MMPVDCTMKKGTFDIKAKKKPMSTSLRARGIKLVMVGGALAVDTSVVGRNKIAKKSAIPTRAIAGATLAPMKGHKITSGTSLKNISKKEVRRVSGEIPGSVRRWVKKAVSTNFSTYRNCQI